MQIVWVSLAKTETSAVQANAMFVMLKALSFDIWKSQRQTFQTQCPRKSEWYTELNVSNFTLKTFSAKGKKLWITKNRLFVIWNKCHAILSKLKFQTLKGTTHWAPWEEANPQKCQMTYSMLQRKNVTKSYLFMHRDLHSKRGCFTKLICCFQMLWLVIDLQFHSINLVFLAFLSLQLGALNEPSMTGHLSYPSTPYGVNVAWRPKVSSSFIGVSKKLEYDSGVSAHILS